MAETAFSDFTICGVWYDKNDDEYHCFDYAGDRFSDYRRTLSDRKVNLLPKRL